MHGVIEHAAAAEFHIILTSATTAEAVTFWCDDMCKCDCGCRREVLHRHTVSTPQQLYKLVRQPW
jgi:hypothetical protein